MDTTSQVNQLLNTDTVTIDGVNVQSYANKIARFACIGGENKPRIEMHAIRGTFENPQPLEPGDFGVSLEYTTFLEENGEDISKSLAAFVVQVDPDANTQDIAPASGLWITVNSGEGLGDYKDNYRVWHYNKNGAFETKILQCAVQNNSSIESIEPKNGMIIYNEDSHKFQGYANGTWVDLHQ
jgi:hypothetical protein